jgi:1-acyl-sn-glycerol-3-phosphate acyltransferase
MHASPGVPHDARAASRDASRATTWLRRAVSVPGLLVLALVDLVVLPAALLGAFVVDLVRRHAFAAVRFQLALAFALWIHVVGLLLLGRAWVTGLYAGWERERDLDLESEVWWATTTWRAATRLYGMRVEVEGEDALEGGPIILMARHASLLDVLLPLVFGSGRHGLRLRYVAKRELLWDPCIDLVGRRLPTAFVRRDRREHEAEVALVLALANDLGPNDGVVIFPEGTRFSEAKRTRALAALAEHDVAGFAHGVALQQLLPPHVGGPLGLLDRAPGADVVFCAHAGLEGASHLRDLVGGSLVGKTVSVRFWRVRAADIPKDRDERVLWLRAWWTVVDAWVTAHRRAERIEARDPCVQPNRGAVTSATVPKSLMRT